MLLNFGKNTFCHRIGHVDDLYSSNNRTEDNLSYELPPENLDFYNEQYFKKIRAFDLIGDFVNDRVSRHDNCSVHPLHNLQAF